MVGLTMAAVVVAGTVSIGAEGPPTAPERLEALKTLAGTWVGDMDGDGEMDSEVVFRVTSAGNAVHETMFPGTEHEMVNLFHLDGDDLVMTHYCAVGNQPRMRAAPGDAHAIRFEFDSATNVAGPNQPVMGHAVFTLVDEHTLREDWQATVDGKPQPQMTFNLKRKDAMAEVEAPEGMPGFVEYTVVVLRPVEGRPDLPEEEASGIQERHLAHLRSMREKGVMVYAGPFGDRSGGMCIYKGPGIDEVRALAEADPAVRAGRLTVQAHPWLVPGGLGEGGR
jgi:uncharacterized protein YciI